MDEELIKGLIGVIFIILIINTTMVLDIASRSPSQDNSVGQGAGVTGAVGNLKNPAATTPAVTTPVPAITTVPKTIPPTPAATQGKNLITSYVTIETPIPQITEARPFIQADVSRPSYDNFITIYSLSDQTLTQDFPLISFNLVNPPLIIDYAVKPYNVTDLKYYEYKMKSTYYTETINITRPYEDTWFNIVVRNKDTGEIIAEDGFGRLHSTENLKRLSIQKSGNFQFEYDGQFGYLTLTMKVNKTGNIP